MIYNTPSSIFTSHTVSSCGLTPWHFSDLEFSITLCSHVSPHSRKQLKPIITNLTLFFFGESCSIKLPNCIFMTCPTPVLFATIITPALGTHLFLLTKNLHFLLLGFFLWFMQFLTSIKVWYFKKNSMVRGLHGQIIDYNIIFTSCSENKRSFFVTFIQTTTLF